MKGESEMKIRKRRNPNGSTSWFIDYRENGKRKRHVLKDISKKEQAEKALVDFQNKRLNRRMGLATHPNLTVEECLNEFVAVKKANCIKSYGDSLTARAKQMTEILGKNRLVESLDELAATELKRALRERGDAPPTINKKLTMIKGAVRKAHHAGKIGFNPLANIEMVSDSREKKDCRWLKDEEIERLLGVLKDGLKIEVKPEGRAKYEWTVPPQFEVYRLVVFLLNTGARRGEAWRVRWDDIDLENKRVRLWETKKAARGRTAKPRYIPINSALQDLFKGMERSGELVFPPDNNLRRKFDRAVELAKIGACRVHDLRHTFASHLAINGVPINTIRELLGHTTITMTLRYAHLCPSVTAQAVEALNFGGNVQIAKIMAVGE